MCHSDSPSIPGSSSADRPGISSVSYWKQAAAVFGNRRLWVYASITIALRVILKMFKVPLAAGLNLTFDCYVNALGSLLYGPLMGLLVGALSDTIGCIIAPSGPYFFPFIFVEMGSSFIFGLFLWNRKLSVPRILASRFTVSLICNIVLTSLFMKWSYYIFYGIEKAEAYTIINLARIAKNLVLFPLESIVITFFFRAMLPPLRAIGFGGCLPSELPLRRRHYAAVGLLTLFSAALVLFYIFFLKDYIAAHNLKWL